MNQDKLVSIAMTTYNGEKYLKEQLNSIYNQTYQNTEVVVTDDRSSDNTISILENYKDKYNLKYYINDHNLGFSKNFEKAISLCKGDYIALADQDDIWLPDKIEILVNEIKDHSLIYSDARLIDSQENIIAESFVKSSDLLANDTTPFLYLFFRKFIYGCTILFKKEVINEALPIPYDCFQHDWWLPVAASKINGIKYVDKPLILYRLHGNNQIGASENPSLSYKAIRYIFSNEQRKDRNSRRLNRKKILEAALESDLYLNPDEKTVLEETIDYYKWFLDKKFSIKSFINTYKHKDLIYNRNYYFFLDVLGYMLYKA